MRPFAPMGVVYVYRGGQVGGEEIAKLLQVPLFSLDIRYPVSRILEKLPSPLAFLVWLVKELLYRTTGPGLEPTHTHLPSSDTKILLVDDSASTGRTLNRALGVLYERGFTRSQIMVVVFQVSKRVQHMVDIAVL